jgi:hypothetical protein
MPDLNVCTGRAFGVGSLGELEPANARPAPWPFSSSPATAAAQMAAANGLRYDQSTITPGGGLWVPQVGPATASSRQSGAPASSIAVAGSATEATLTSVAFVNTSSVQTLAVKATLTWSASILFGGSTWMELWGGATLSVGAPSVAFAALDSSPAGTGSFVWTANCTDTLVFTVAPASTVNVIPRIGVKNVAGASAMTWNSWRFSLGAFSALLDPVAEG